MVSGVWDWVLRAPEDQEPVQGPFRCTVCVCGLRHAPVVRLHCADASCWLRSQDCGTGRAKASSEAPAAGADKADAVGARRGSLQNDTGGGGGGAAAEPPGWQKFLEASTGKYFHVNHELKAAVPAEVYEQRFAAEREAAANAKTTVDEVSLPSSLQQVARTSVCVSA